MNRIQRASKRLASNRSLGLGAVLLLSLGGAAAVGCGWEPQSDEEGLRSTENEIDVTQTSGLTRKNLEPAQSNETARRADTTSYYGTVGTAKDGSGPVVSVALNTLQKFRDRYHFESGEQIAYYYNRGDLGIGREMHCVDKIRSTGTTAGEIACYVSNFAAGDDNTEFTFGQSASIAFANMDANHAFATVAMVFRDNAPADKKIFFAVYSAANNPADTALLNNAALDRPGILFAKNIDTSSTPGVNFNNHIPSNCLNCHGGDYTAATHTVEDSHFLPFDLDQFEYQDASGKRRNDQLTAFKKLNEMAWKTAARTAGGENITDQLDVWYGNQSSHQADSRDEILEGSFTSGNVPPGWAGSNASKDIYSQVIRPACRGCHISNRFPFNDEASFLGVANVAAGAITGYDMPHAVQTSREFWLSSMPTLLGNYLAAKGKSSAAAALAAGSPGNVATLDPDVIVTAVF